VKSAYLEADIQILEPKGGILGTQLGAARGVGGPMNGATAATAILYRSREEGELTLLAANIGNCAILLKSDQGLRVISALHTPDNQTEYQRIMNLENPNPNLPLIREKGGRLRVGGTLGLTRAFGNAFLKPNFDDDDFETEEKQISKNDAIGGSFNSSLPLESGDRIRDFGLTPEPDVSTLTVSSSDEWVMVASNGLVRHREGEPGLDLEEIERIVDKLAEQEPNEICSALATAARKEGSESDLTIIFVPIIAREDADE